MPNKTITNVKTCISDEIYFLDENNMITFWIYHYTLELHNFCLQVIFQCMYWTYINFRTYFFFDGLYFFFLFLTCHSSWNTINAKSTCRDEQCNFIYILMKRKRGNNEKIFLLQGVAHHITSFISLNCDFRDKSEDLNRLNHFLKNVSG